MKRRMFQQPPHQVRRGHLALADDYAIHIPAAQHLLRIIGGIWAADDQKAIPVPAFYSFRDHAKGVFTDCETAYANELRLPFLEQRAHFGAFVF